MPLRSMKRFERQDESTHHISGLGILSTNRETDRIQAKGIEGIMERTYIFNNKDGYTWDDYPYEGNELVEMLDGGELAYAFENSGLFFHECKLSALYYDVTGYVDTLQGEEELADNELYVVIYYRYDEKDCNLDQLVDFGVTKDEIIQNVLNQKYVEGADYCTIGNMFYHTRKLLEELR